MATPYIVGGFPRDIVLKRFESITDVDITCGNKDSEKLGNLLVKKFPGTKYIVYSDGHGRFEYERFKLDFSNNFNVPGIAQILEAMNIKNPTEMQKEMYSRDFTINCLLMPLNLSTVHDLTNKSMKDLSSKIIDTCLPPRITLLSDPRRIARIIYLGAKLGFNPSERVKTWVTKNPQSILSAPENYVKEKINEAIKVNKEHAISLIRTMNLINHVPLTNDIIALISGV